MQSKPLVSVVIPTYNRAGFITGAIQSVLKQSYQNIEIIVVDDGSTDNTREVLEPFRDNIHYIFTDNRGPAHARNTGMKAAVGKYISFLDSDDIYLPYKLSLQVTFLEAHPEVGMVYTEVTGFDDAGFFEEYHLRSYHELYNRKGWAYKDILPENGDFLCDAVRGPVPFFIGNLFRYVLLGPLVLTTTVLYSRSILDTVGYQNEAYRLAEEYEHTLRICKWYKVGFLDIPTYRLRYHETQISRAKQQWTKERALIWIEVEKIMLQALLDLGIGDKEYYNDNSTWLNTRAAELYHCIGEKWLEYGNAREARECFRNGLSFDPQWGKNRLYWYLSFFPSTMRRVFWGLSRRIRI